MPDPPDLKDFVCLNDVEDATGVHPGIRVEACGTPYCTCGYRMWVRPATIREPVFPPGFKACILPVGELPELLGFRDSCVLCYVCSSCRHYYLDFTARLDRSEAEELALRHNQEMES